MASTTYETKRMADSDYDKALIFVIVGVFITLIIIKKSLSKLALLKISI